MKALAVPKINMPGGLALDMVIVIEYDNSLPPREQLADLSIPYAHCWLAEALAEVITHFMDTHCIVPAISSANRMEARRVVGNRYAGIVQSSA